MAKKPPLDETAAAEAAAVAADEKYKAPAPKEKKGKLAPAASDGVAKVLTPAERLELFLKSPGAKSYAKEHTSAKVTQATEFRSVIPRIPTGLIQVDLMLRGGIPTGVQHHWFGDKATGKTTLALIAIACGQRLCSTCYKPMDTPGGCCDSPRAFLAGFINVEGVLDWRWAAALGVKREELLYSEPETAEQTLDGFESLLASGEVDLVVVDSLAAMIPASELGKSAAEFDVGSQARAAHRLVRKSYSYLNQMGNRTGRRATIILLNQNRMKVGVMFGNPETQAAGSGPGYGSAVELRFSPAKHQKDSDDPNGDPLYVTIAPKVAKSKLFPGKGAEAEFSLLQKDTADQKLGDIYDAPQLVDLGTKAGLIEGAAPSVTCLGRSFRGKSSVEVELIKDKAFAAELRAATIGILQRS